MPHFATAPTPAAPAAATMSTAGLPSAPAPMTGVYLGARVNGGAALLRLFRASGTRIAVLAGPTPAQLIALRAARAGAAVQIKTARPRTWAPLLEGTPAWVNPLTTETAGVDGPLLVVDDRPDEASGLGDVASWQCRIDIRAPWTPSDLLGFGYADAVLMGLMSSTMAAAVSVVFGIDRRPAGVLTSLEPGTLAVVSRGSLFIVRLDPTADEVAQLNRTQQR